MKPEGRYLSPTAILTYIRCPSDYYIKYVLKEKIESDTPTPPMLLGSCFDAIVKNKIKGIITGSQLSLSLSDIPDSSILPHGLHLWEQYVSLGGYSDLLIELKNRSVVTMEEDCYDVIFDVPLYGKPDLYFTNSSGHSIVYDFKVNGYFSKTKKSNSPGLVVSREIKEKLTRTRGDALTSSYPDNITYSTIPGPFDWSVQLCIYSWILGEIPFTSFLVGIEQLAGLGEGEYGNIKCNSYRWMITSDFQVMLRDKIIEIWNRTDWSEFEHLKDAEFRMMQ